MDYSLAWQLNIHKAHKIIAKYNNLPKGKQANKTSYNNFLKTNGNATHSRFPSSSSTTTI
jgi:hypothetical protein